MKKRRTKSVPHEKGLLEDLKDPEFVVHFLSSAIEGLPAEEASDILVDGIALVAKAQGMTRVAERSGIMRESLYRALKKRGNPTLSTLHGVLEGIGIEMSFRVKKRAR